MVSCNSSEYVLYTSLFFSQAQYCLFCFFFSSYGNEPEIKSLRDSDVQTYEFLHSHLHTDHIGYNYYYQNLDSRFQRYEQNIHPNHFIGNKIYRPLFSSFYSYQSINIHTSRSSTIPLYYSEPKISALILGSPEFYSDIVKFVFANTSLLGNNPCYKMHPRESVPYELRDSIPFYGALVLLTPLSIF